MLDFLMGSKIYQINCDYLNDIHMMMIKESITSKFDIEFVEEEKETYINALRNKVCGCYEIWGKCSL